MILSVHTLAEIINNKERIAGFDDYHGKITVYLYRNGKKFYVKSYRDYKYTWTRQQLYAKAYTEKTAVQHLNRINSLIKEGAIL